MPVPESDLWRDIWGALTGNTYVEPLESFVDPSLSDWEVTAQRKKREEQIRRSKLGLDPQKDPLFSGISGGSDPVDEYLSGLKSGRVVPPGFAQSEIDPMHKLAQERFAEADAATAAKAPEEEKAAKLADLQKLIEAGKSASAQRDFMRGTTPLIEDYDKGKIGRAHV